PRPEPNLPDAAGPEPADAAATAAAIRLADVRPVQQLLARGLSAGLQLRAMAVHRADVSVPARAARLAVGEPDLGRRHLVVPPQPDRPRLVARAVPLIRPSDNPADRRPRFHRPVTKSNP